MRWSSGAPYLIDARSPAQISIDRKFGLPVPLKMELSRSPDLSLRPTSERRRTMPKIPRQPYILIMNDLLPIRLEPQVLEYEGLRSIWDSALRSNSTLLLLFRIGSIRQVAEHPKIVLDRLFAGTPVHALAQRWIHRNSVHSLGDSFADN